VSKTPLEAAPLLSKITGNRVFVKREDLLPVRSFKLRGAYNRIAQLSHAESAVGVIAASAGNHAQGVAYAARLLGIKATLVVPVTTPEIKVAAICELGAELVLYGENYDEAYEHARKLSNETGKQFIHPYDDPDVIAGQGTVGLEIAEQHNGPIEAIFVPVGGGGLISGVALAMKQLRPGVKVFGVEASDSDAMSRSLHLGERITLDNVGLFADGCAVRKVGELTYAIAKEWVDGIIVVSNDEICAAVRGIFDDSRAIIEPSGALSYAGLKKWSMTNQVEGSLVAILSGANVNFERLQFIAERAKVGSHSEAIFAIHIPEKAGTFRDLCKAIGKRNLTEFNYRMGDQNKAIVFAGIAVKGDNDRAEVQKALTQAGYEAIDLTEDEVAKLHLRHMVGGRSSDAAHERIFRIEMPEKAGALQAFLDRLNGRWNISLFHYRNHGSDRGRALVGFQVPSETTKEFELFLASSPDRIEEETDSEAVKLFLGIP
jgi:threonine dehydratase